MSAIVIRLLPTTFNSGPRRITCATYFRDGLSSIPKVTLLTGGQQRVGAISHLSSSLSLSLSYPAGWLALVGRPTRSCCEARFRHQPSSSYSPASTNRVELWVRAHARRIENRARQTALRRTETYPPPSARCRRAPDANCKANNFPILWDAALEFRPIPFVAFGRLPLPCNC